MSLFFPHSQETSREGARAEPGDPGITGSSTIGNRNAMLLHALPISPPSSRPHRSPGPWGSRGRTTATRAQAGRLGKQPLSRPGLGGFWQRERREGASMSPPGLPNGQRTLALRQGRRDLLKDKFNPQSGGPTLCLATTSHSELHSPGPRPTRWMGTFLFDPHNLPQPGSNLTSHPSPAKVSVIQEHIYPFKKGGVLAKY